MKKLKLKKIKLHSRDRVNNWLEHYKDNTYVLRSELNIRAGYTDSNHDKLMFVDPSGGPFIATGDVLEEVGKEVTEINHIDGVGFTITFKE